MSEEIKEILDNLKEWSVEGNLYFEINDEKAKKLYNYITNLQQENKQLKEELKSANEEITWWSNRFNAVERDNRQLKEALKDIEELLLNEEQPIQPSYIRYNILKIIEKALGDKENE